ncbi:MAG: S41 family peptidase [Xanthomonadales bacterium]|nr:S41 family peptidase [Xanthomonadales bacterium]
MTATRYLALYISLITLCTPALSGSMLSPDIIRKDFTQLYESLQSAHVDLYVSMSESDYDRAFRQTLERFTQPMPQTDVIAEFQRFVALGNVAHARVESAAAAFSDYLAAGGTMLPLSLRIQGDRAFVTDFFGDGPQPSPGDEIIRFNSEPTVAMLQRFRAHVSADTRLLANTQIEIQLPRLVWHAYGDRASFDVVLRNADGREVAMTIESVSYQVAQGAAGRHTSGLELSWSDREARVLPDGIAYLRPGPFYSTEGDDPWNTAGFRTFVDDAFGKFMEADSSRLLIDLRNNPGGDASFSDLMIAWLADRPFRFYSEFRVRVSPEAEASNATRLVGDDVHWVSRAYAREFASRKDGETFSFEMPFVQPREGQRFQGDVYVLVNRHSYSNAVTTAAILQDYEFAVVLGEETADLASTLGAMEHFTLDETGIRVGFPKAQIVRPNGDATRRGVIPDLQIQTPRIEGKEDPVLKAALALINNQGR